MTSSTIQPAWAGEEPHAQNNIFAMVHRLLRGRYLITVVAAGVFAVTGGAVGYLSQEPLFRSDAVIQIQPVLPKILYETELSSAPQMFNSFVASQAELMKGQNVIQYAMDSDRWQSVRGLTEINTVEAFSSRLQVRSSRATQQLIQVTFEDEEARVAHAGAQSLVDAYMELHGRSTELTSEATLGILETRRNNLRAQKAQRDADIARIARDWGTDELGMQIGVAFEAVQAYTEEERALRTQIEDLQAAITQNADGGQASGLSLERAVEIDPGTAELVAIRRDLEAQRRSYITSGILQGHRDFRRVESALTQVEAQIRERLATLEDAIANDGAGTVATLAGVSIESLRTRLARVEERLAETRQTRDRLSQDNLALRDLNMQRADLEREIQRTEQRIDALRLESQAADISEVTGRVSVVGQATMSGSPSSDKRIKMAGAGFVGGGAVPVALMLGLGMIGRRIRYSDDNILGSTHSRIVGVLPDLGKSITDRELAEASAFAVHQIRSQLQILYGHGHSGVFAVTSPAPGDGKTSMIIALGLSYAESGDRTLLIDLDLIGRGLSLHFGHPAAPSLAEAAARGDDLTELIRPSRFENLSILPAGAGDDMRISRLSPSVIRRIVDTFSGRYDTILIDSGPILGSIEAGLLAPAVDGVMLVVGRNQLRPLVKRAVDQITSVGGQVIATVFNRASIQELRQSSSSMSVHFSRQASRQAAEQAASGQTSVGPLGGSLFTPADTATRGERGS